MIRVARGDIATEAELIRIRDVEKRQLLLPPKVNDELLNGNVLTTKGANPVKVPGPAETGAIEALKGRLRLRVDMEGARSASGGLAQRMRDNMDAVNNLSESDAVVLTQVKARARVRGVQNPILFTNDTRSLLRKLSEEILE
jgi:hypothetical protein